MNQIKNNISSNEPKHLVKLEGFSFGPLIGHTFLDKPFLEELRSRGDKSNVSYKTELAGHLDIENSYNQDDIQWFMEYTANIFKNYVDMLSRFILGTTINKSPLARINLNSLWINYMKSGEFNPLHDHTGDISFVIYLQVPKEIKEENKKFDGVGSGPGVISFYYGEKIDNIKTQYHFLPKAGDMFLFPATTKHMVAPFKSDVTRISVSGNLIFK